MKTDVLLIFFKQPPMLVDRLRYDLCSMARHSVELHVWDNRLHQKNLATIKNQFAEKATGDYVMFANGDILPSQGWDAKLCGFLQENPQAAAVLPLPVGDMRSKELWIDEVPLSMLGEGLPSREQMKKIQASVEGAEGHYVYDGQDRFCPFFSVFMARSTWADSKGFDERLRFMGSDREYMKRFISMGRFTAGLRSCAFYHAGGGSLKEIKEPGDLDLKAEWKHRHTIFPQIESGKLKRWHKLTDAERDAVRVDPKYANLAVLT